MWEEGGVLETLRAGRRETQRSSPVGLGGFPRINPLRCSDRPCYRPFLPGGRLTHDVGRPGVLALFYDVSRTRTSRYARFDVSADVGSWGSGDVGVDTGQ